MKRKLFNVLLVLALVLSISLVSAVPVAAAKPTTFTTTYYQTQFQWRANKGQEFGDWWKIYQTYPSSSSSDFKLTGNVLHSFYVYSPVVTDLEGESTVYTYDKKKDLWIEKEGTVSYKYEPLYGDYPIVNYWRGYLEFDGTPSEGSFVRGVAYQWAYLAAPHGDDPPLPYAQWDDTMDAWLVGFSIYLWDATAPLTPHDIPFPDPFIEPVPASSYNPLDL